MESSTLMVSEKELFPMMLEMLNEGKDVRFNISGNSMFPLLVHHRDSVVLRKCNNELRKGDIILFKVSNYHHVLHRITKVLNDGFITTGDGNLHRDGFVSNEKVIAKAITIYRKDKVIDVSDWKWKFIFSIWMFLYPIRKELLYFIRKIHGLLK